MDKPKLISKYLIVDGRYIKTSVNMDEVNARLDDPILRHTVNQADSTEWKTGCMIELDDIRDYNPVNESMYGEVATRVTFHNGDEHVIRLSSTDLLIKLIEREEFLFNYSLYLGDVKLLKNKR